MKGINNFWTPCTVDPLLSEQQDGHLFRQNCSNLISQQSSEYFSTSIFDDVVMLGPYLYKYRIYSNSSRGDYL